MAVSRYLRSISVSLKGMEADLVASFKHLLILEKRSKRVPISSATVILKTLQSTEREPAV